MSDLKTTRLWAVTLPYLQAIRSGALEAASDVWAARGATRNAGEVAVIPVMGVITQRGGWYGTSVERIQAALRDATASGAKAIVLDVDSPGGEVYGMDEIAEEIRAVRKTTPVVGVANSLAASAAYNIISQADEVFVTPSGEIGSVGVYGMHMDMSAALDQMGLKITFVTAGEGKVEGNAYAPLSEAAMEDMQTDIDRYYQMFVRNVSKGRQAKASPDQIRSEWGAWVYGAPEAVSIGMADHVGTLDDAIRRAGQLARERKSKSALAEVEVTARARARRV